MTAATDMSQTEIWVDRHGVEHRIDDMSLDYKRAVVGFIERRATRMVHRAVIAKYVDRIIALPTTIPCVECEHRGNMHPHEWEHGVWHGVGPAPGSEAEAILSEDPGYDPLGLDRIGPFLAAEFPPERCVEIVRSTPLMQRMLRDIGEQS